MPANDLKFRQETKGRLVLWSWALTECQIMFEKLRHLGAHMEVLKQIPPDLDRQAAYMNYLTSLPHYQPGTVRLADIKAFDRANPLPFPQWGDCWSFQTWTRMLIVVTFCRLHKSGYAEEGHTAGNSLFFRETHWPAVVNKAIIDAAKRERFDQFTVQCLELRDTFLGHSDGAAATVREHQPGVIQTQSHFGLVNKLDFSVFEQTVDQLIDVISHAIVEIEAQSPFRQG